MNSAASIMVAINNASHTAAVLRKRALGVQSKLRALKTEAAEHHTRNRIQRIRGSINSVT